jgi:hypothetical protein
MFFGFTKQTEKQPKQIEFRFVLVQTEKNIWLFRGHPICQDSEVHSVSAGFKYSPACVQEGGAKLA